RGDTIARIGGDEFVILIQSDSPEIVYQRLLAEVGQPIPVADTFITVSACLGAAIYPDDNTDAEGLIRHADQAMYAAKEKGRNQLVEIGNALENNEFELYFQPQVRLADCQVVGFEALIRWNHPARGLTMPGEFLPAVENSHLEVPLGSWVLKEAIHQMNLWNE